MTDILTQDKKIHKFDPIHMFTDKLGAIELPHPPNIKIEENPKLFAIYELLYHKIKTIPSFCILSNAERIICSRKCIFGEI